MKSGEQIHRAIVTGITIRKNVDFWDINLLWSLKTDLQFQFCLTAVHRVEKMEELSSARMVQQIFVFMSPGSTLFCHMLASIRNMVYAA